MWSSTGPAGRPVKVASTSIQWCSGSGKEKRYRIEPARAGAAARRAAASAMSRTYLCVRIRKYLTRNRQPAIGKLFPDAITWDNQEMALLSPTDQQTLRGMFDDMTRTVTIVFFTQTIGCETCDETRRILGELTPLTDKIVVEELNLVLDKERAAAYGVDRAPAIALLADRADTRIRFLGMPAGYDFMALVDAILAISGASDSELSAESLALVA